MYSFKLDGKRLGWWYGSVKAKVKTGGSVITQTPDSIKNWKKFWFFVRGPWQFSVNATRPDVNIPVCYHELRYISQEPTEKSSERARTARDISEDLRSSSALIIEENLILTQLSPSSSERPRAHQLRREMKHISASLKKKTQAEKGKRKVPTRDQEPSVRQKVQPDLLPHRVPSPARSVEEITSFPIRAGPSSSQAFQPPPTASKTPPTYLESTLEKDDEFLRLRGALPKPVCDFIRSNSPTKDEIAGLLLSIRRVIRMVAKCWTPVQQKYLDSMGVVDSVMAVSVNTSRAAIQLTSAFENMSRLLADLETAKKDKAELKQELEAERKNQAEIRTALEKSVDKDETVTEFKSSNAYLADQEKVYFLTIEELIEAAVEKRLDWDI
ncbi:hypothetical protein Adt_24499 [Abeliophyllum distichum]|uniref:Uncharacterized protein n=1 Tax=Abeliophyllum distichum TaxID=126358 RepID=A0ABD1SDY1_9LAMI